MRISDWSSDVCSSDLQAIGVIGANTHGVAEALFLRTFSERITLVAQETIDLGPDDRAALAAAGIAIAPKPLARMDFSDDRVALHLPHGTEMHFDTVSPELGCDRNTAPARTLERKRA